MPRIDHIDDLQNLTGFILKCISSGKLSIADGEQLTRVCQQHGKALEINQLLQRMEALEEKLT